MLISFFFSRGVQGSLKTLVNLETLHFNNVELSDIASPFIKTLQATTISSSGNSDGTIGRLSESLETLQVTQIQPEILGRFSNLKNLAILGAQAGLEDELSKLHKLEFVILSTQHHFHAHADGRPVLEIGKLSGLKELRFLSISGFEFAAPDFPAYPFLHTLDMPGCSFDTTTLLQLAAHVPNLRCLGLARCQTISKKRLLAADNRLKRVELDNQFNALALFPIIMTPTSAYWSGGARFL